MKNYLDMILKGSSDLQPMFDYLTNEYNQTEHSKLEPNEEGSVHHFSIGECVAHNQLDIKDDPVAVHCITMCYRHTATLRFYSFIDELVALYGGDTKNVAPTLLSPVAQMQDQIVDAYTDYCVRLAVGDLAKHAMSYEVFLKLYGEGNQKDIQMIDQPYVMMDFMLFNTHESQRGQGLEFINFFVEVGKMVNVNSKLDELKTEAIERRYFEDGVETSSPIK